VCSSQGYRAKIERKGWEFPKVFSAAGKER